MEYHVTKKARYEQPEDEMPLQQPHITSAGSSHFLPSNEVAASLNENQPYSQEKEEEEETTERVSSSMDYFQSLRRREWCDDEDNRKLPNIFREYNLRAFDFVSDIEVSCLLIVRDILFVIYDYYYLVPLRLYGEMSPLTDQRGLPIIIKRAVMEDMCYNYHNNSLIVEVTTMNDIDDEQMTSLVSFDIASIAAGQYPEQRELFRPEELTEKWDFDFPNCRGMIYDKNDRVFKFFELKEYTEVFRIPDSTDKKFTSTFKFGSPGNRDMLIMIENKKNDKRKEVLFRIYSKATGQLRKEISIPVSPGRSIEYVDLCGPDRIVVQQQDLEMQVMDISSEICKIIKSTHILLACPSIYLAKRSGVLCVTETSAYLCDLQGEIVVTFEDHGVFDASNCRGSYVTTEEDIMISVCGFGQYPEHPQSINISSIVTAKILGKITTDAPNCLSELRGMAFQYMRLWAFAYDERTHDIISGNTRGTIFVWSNKLCRDVPNTSKSIVLPISEDDEEEDLEAG